jgi:transposase
MTDYPIVQDAAPASSIAIDIAKDVHVVVVESSRGRRQFRLANPAGGCGRLRRVHPRTAPAGPHRLRADWAYHRPLAYQLVTAGFDVVLISSLACARYRAALFTSWDKNDPKDTHVLLELLKEGITMRYVDPLVARWHDVQEVAKPYWHVTPARTRVQHSLRTPYLPL